MENLNAEQVKKELQEILDKFAGSLNRYYTLFASSTRRSRG